MPNQTPENLFQERLKHLHRRTLLRVGWFGVARVVGVGGSLLMLTVWLLGQAVEPERFVTYGFLVTLGLALVALLWNNLLGRVWRLRNEQQWVHLAEKRGYFANVLIASEEAVRDTARWSDKSSVAIELRRRLFVRAADHLQRLQPADVVPFNRQGQTWLAVALCMLLSVTFVTAPGPTLDQGWQRLWNPGMIWTEAPLGGLHAVDGDGFVVAGGSLVVEAFDSMGNPDKAYCEIKMGTGEWQPLMAFRLPIVSNNLTRHEPYRRWVANVESIQEDFQWRFRRAETTTEAQKVQVRHHPMITELAGLVNPPPYMHLITREMKRLPTWLEVPSGSTLNLTGETNHDLQSLVLVSSLGDTLPLAITGSSFAGEFSVTESASLHFVLLDSFGLSNVNPLHYEIIATEDDIPIAGLHRANDDGILPIHGLVEMETEAADDYGLSSLILGFRLNDQKGSLSDSKDEFESYQIWPQQSHSSGEINWSTSAGEIVIKPQFFEGFDSSESQPLQMGIFLESDFSRLNMVPGDVLELRVEARDNRRPLPRGVGFSNVIRLQLPSAADVLAAQADSSMERRGELEEMRNRGKKLGADLDRLTRELLKNPIPDWARQKEMEAAMERQKRMQEELSKVAQQLQQDVDKLASSQMASEQMLDRAEEISQLLDQSSSAELDQLMRKMENSEGRLSPEELANAMQEVAKNQKEMARKLDAALAMMQRMDQQQEMEGIASLLEKMIRKQQELADLSRQLAEEKEQAANSEGSENKESSESAEGESGESEQDSESEQKSESGDPQESGSENESGEKSESNSEGESQETPDAEELARRQEALSEEMEQLREKLEEALANLEEKNAEKQTPGSEEMQKALEQALQQMDQQKSKESMSKASEALSQDGEQMDPEMAAKMQQQALRDMGSLYHVILKTQSAMQAAMDQHQVSSLRQLAADMLALSDRQEKIAGQIPARIRDVRTLNLTRDQHRIQKAAIGVRDRLNLLLESNPKRILKLLAKVDEVIEKQGEGLRALEENRAQTARKATTSSLALANRMVIGLLTEAQMSSSSSGGSGDQQQQMSLSEQLKSMAKDQAELNAMTEQMRQMLANRGISQQARAQMKRLGEGQGQLAGRMQELAEEARENPEGDRVLGDLGQLGDLMETLSQEVEQGLVSEETLIRQERILSRMLDARNSVRQRDYSSRRESHTAQELYGKNGGLYGGTLDGTEKSPFDLRYQPLEKAPLEYRGLVRRYFEALEKMRKMKAREVEVP